MSSEQVKILCINSNGLHNDGITNSILNYYSHMEKTDVSIHLLKTKDIEPNLGRRIENLGLKIVFTEYRENVFLYIIKTAILVRKEKYDIVHVHGSSAILTIDLLAAWLGGCKVRIAHSRNTKCNYVKTDKILRPFFNLLCTDRFACGEDAGRWLFGNQAFKVIRNGKDLEQFKFDAQKREKIRAEFGCQDKIILGHVGNFNYQKNHEFLLNVFAELKKKNLKYLLVLIGSGAEYLIKAKEQARALDIEDSILFMGSIDNVDEMLQAMDIMLLPSRFEGLPNVVLEWQISGLPEFISNKITRECKVTDLVEYLPIDQGTDVWVKKIIATPVKNDRIQESQNACICMKKAQFDITENAKHLKELYLSFDRRG